jgi:cytochrome c biogenesis factor
MMVFVGSILMLVGAGIYTILGIDLLALVVEYGRYADGFDYFAAIFAFIAAAVLVVVGIMGIKNAADIHKGDFLFPLGIAVCIIPVISLAIVFVQGTSPVSEIGGFLLPWPFIFGANTMKQQAQAIGGPSYPGAAQQYPGAQQYPAVSPQYPASPQQYPAAPQQYPGTPGQYPGTTQPYPGTPGQ